MLKIKIKHEKESSDYKNENQRHIEKIHQYEDRCKNFSSQIYSMNEKQLMLMKDNEIMKSKLRVLEHSTSMMNGRSSGLPMKLLRGN